VQPATTATGRWLGQGSPQAGQVRYGGEVCQEAESGRRHLSDGCGSHTCPHAALQGAGPPPLGFEAWQAGCNRATTAELLELGDAARQRVIASPAGPAVGASAYRLGWATPRSRSRNAPVVCGCARCRNTDVVCVCRDSSSRRAPPRLRPPRPPRGAAPFDRGGQSAGRGPPVRWIRVCTSRLETSERCGVAGRMWLGRLVCVRFVAHGGEVEVRRRV